MSDEMFPVAILAGGLATRLRPMTEAIPKSLVDVNGEPFVYHQLRLLRSRGVDRIVICLGHLGEMIAEAVGDGTKFGVRVTYSSDGSRLLGTAGAVKKALPILGDQFFVLYGDSYLPCDFAAAQRAFVRGGTLALMTVFQNDGRWDHSNVEYAGGRIVAYNKTKPTPRMRHIDFGLGVVDQRAFDGVPEEQPYDLAAVYEDLLHRGQLTGFEVDERFYEIGSLDGLAEMRHLAARWPTTFKESK